jgi:hypothetical protein
VDVARRALREALERKIGPVGGPELVLALVAEPSVAAEILVENGITYERVAERFCGERVTRMPDGSLRPASNTTGLSMNPDGYKVCGRAEGLALAAGFAEPRPEDWLIALLYSGDGMGFAAVLQVLEVSRPALVDSMRRRGLVLPEVELPPLTRPRVIKRP